MSWVWLALVRALKVRKTGTISAGRPVVSCCVMFSVLPTIMIKLQSAKQRRDFYILFTWYYLFHCIFSLGTVLFLKNMFLLQAASPFFRKRKIVKKIYIYIYIYLFFTIFTYIYIYIYILI